MKIDWDDWKSWAGDREMLIDAIAIDALKIFCAMCQPEEWMQPGWKGVTSLQSFNYTVLGKDSNRKCFPARGENAFPVRHQCRWLRRDQKRRAPGPSTKTDAVGGHFSAALLV